MFNAAEIAALRDEIETDPAGVGYPSLAGLSGTDLDAALATTARMLVEPRSSPNPVAQTSILRPITTLEALGNPFTSTPGLIAAADVQAMEDTFAERVHLALESNDMQKIQTQMVYAAVRGWLSPASIAALSSRLDTENPDNMMPDPTWQSNVPGPSRATIVCRSVSGQGRDEVPGMGSSQVRTILGIGQ